MALDLPPIPENGGRLKGRLSAKQQTAVTKCIGVLDVLKEPMASLR